MVDSVYTKIKDALASSCSEMPEAPRVACQGVEGAYSQIAAHKLFPNGGITYVKSFEDVFAAIEQGSCDYGMLPVENSTAGTVTAVYELMKQYRFYIVGAIKLKVEHVLLGQPSVRIENLTEIVSHEQALNQCSEYIKRSGIKSTVCENTAVAAKRVAQARSPYLAAISSEDCAELYSLNVLERGIANSPYNYTRFICISKQLEIYEGASKISVVMNAPNRPGALYAMLGDFANLELNLTKLESRPIAGTDFEYMFFLDLEGSVRDDRVLGLIERLTEDGCMTFLGNYTQI